MEEKTEGITLKTIPYSEKNRILTVFTKEFGLISIFVKNSDVKKNLSLTSPFCRGEFVIKRKSQMASFLDGTIFDCYLKLRESQSAIENGYSLAKIILKTQPFPRKSGGIYALFKSYLDHVFLKNGSSLICSFQLKVLLYEGLLNPQSLSDFTDSEKETISSLALERSFNRLNDIMVDEKLRVKIMREEGLEPSQDCSHYHLKVARLPISPSSQKEKLL